MSTAVGTQVPPIVSGIVAFVASDSTLDPMLPMLYAIRKLHINTKKKKGKGKGKKKDPCVNEIQSRK